MVETKGQKIEEHLTLTPISGATSDNNTIYIDSADTFKLKLRNNSGVSSEIGTGAGGGGTLVNATNTTLNTLSEFTLGSIGASGIITDIHVEFATAFDSGTKLSIGTDADPFLIPIIAADVTGLFTISGTFDDHPTLNTSLEARWECDKDGSFPDDTGNGHTGTLVGPTFTASGKLRGAYSFDGVNDQIDFSTAQIISDGTSASTVSMWVNLTVFPPPGMGNASAYALAEFRQASGNQWISNFFNDSGTHKIRNMFRAASTGSAVTITGADFVNKWNHLVFVYKGGTKTTLSNFDTYINGSLFTTGKVAAGAGDVFNNNILGRDGTSPATSFLNGKLDRVFVWQRELTSSEISDLYSLSGPPSQGILLDTSATDLKIFGPMAWSSSGALATGRDSLAASGTQSAGLSFGGNGPSAVTEEYSGTVWSSGGALSTARSEHAGFGTQTDSVAAAGNALTSTEEYNGATWAAGGAVSATRHGGCGVGTLNAGYITGGSANGAAPFRLTTEEYNGTSWSAGTSFNLGRWRHSCSGTQSSAIIWGGLTDAADSTLTNSSELWNDVSWETITDFVIPSRSHAHLGTANSAISAGGKNATVSINPTVLYNDVSWNGLPFVISVANSSNAGAGSTTSGFRCGGFTTTQVTTTENLNPETFSVTTGSLNVRYNTL